VDTLDPVDTVADVHWPGRACGRQGAVVRCLVDDVLTTTLTAPELIVTS
jgi:hypothetical protein